MNDNTITLNQQPRARQIDSNVNIQPQNQNKENSVEEATSIETSNMSGKSTPESGAYLVCKGATCKCEFGSAMLKIEVISQSKAYINDASARQKLIATIKDNVFPPPFFGQCTKNPATGKPCMYSPQDWELTPSTEHPEVNTLLVLTENAYIQCPKFQGKITIVTHGQEITVDSDSIEELDELEALAINCLFEPLEPADDIKKAIVDNIEYNGQKSGNSDLMKVRMNKEIIFKANYRGDKRNISWQLWEKTENLDINDKTSFIYKQQGEELKLLFPKEGKFSLEGFGAFLDARSKEDTSCILKFEVTDKNEITHLSRSNGQVYEPDTLIPLVRKKTYTFTIESLFPFEEEEIETLIVTIKDGRGSILSKGYSHTKDTIIFTPDNVAKYNIFISLGAEGISKTFQIDAQNNEITSVNTQPNDIRVVRPNEKITFILRLKEDINADKDNIAWMIKNPFGLITKSPKKGVSIQESFSVLGNYQIGAVLDENPVQTFFTWLLPSAFKMPNNAHNITVKNNAITNFSFDRQYENITKYPANKIELNIETEMPYNLTSDGGFIIFIKDITPKNADRRMLINSKQIVKLEFEDKNSSNPGLQDANEWYEFLSDPAWTGKVFTNKLNLIFNKTGKYEISIALSKSPIEITKKEITIDESEIVRWCFSDDAGNRYKEIGWYQDVYVDIEAKGWENKEGIVTLYWEKNYAIDPIIDSVDFAGTTQFNNEGVAKIPVLTSTWNALSELVKTNTPKEIKLYFTVSKIDTICKNWKKDWKRDLPDGSKTDTYIVDENIIKSEFLHKHVTIVENSKIKAYFADGEGVLLKKILKYGDPMQIVVQLLLSKKAAMQSTEYDNRYRMHIIENTKATAKNKKDRTPDSYVDHKQKIRMNVALINTFNGEGKYIHLTDTNYSLLSPALHKGIPGHQPRCFYLVLYDSKQVKNGKIECVCQYPKNYNSDKHNDIYLIDTLLDIEDENSSNQYYEVWKQENPKKTKSDWNNYVLEIQNRRLNYFLQLKLAKDAKMNYSFPETKPVIIGEGIDVEKEHKSGHCPRCTAAIRGSKSEWNKSKNKENEVCLKDIFPNATDDILNKVGDTYTKYMKDFGMATCWQKAHFFAQARIEVGTSLKLKEPESINYSTRELLVGRYIEGVKNWKEGNKATKEGGYYQEGTKYRDPLFSSLLKPENKHIAEDYGRKDLNKHLDAGIQKCNQEKLANFIYADENRSKNHGLGNTQSGDGWRFRGRGLIQMTGRELYDKTWKKIKDKEDATIDITTDSGVKALTNEENMRLIILASMGAWIVKSANTKCNGSKDVDQVSKIIGSSVDWEGKKKAFDEITSKLFKVDECQWGKEEYISNGIWHDPVINPQINKYNFSGAVSPRSASFGNVRVRTNGTRRFHTGIDLFAIPETTKVYACLDCKFIAFGNSTITLEIINTKELIAQMNTVKYKLQFTEENEYTAGISTGNFNGKKAEFILKETDKIYVSYMHLFKKLSQKEIENKDGIVKAGTVIGYAGVEGNADKTKAPHLHFEIKNITKDKNRKYYLNPALFIKLQSYDNKEQDAAKKIWRDKANKK